VITLYTYGPFFGLPDASPFVMKGEMLLKLSKLEYQANNKGFLRAPKGKLPYIDDNGTIVADTTLIRLHLELKHGIDFDSALSARERGIAWATEKMLEDHLYWVLVYWRWMKDENFAKGPANFFRRAPAFIRPLIIWKVRGNVRRSLHAHGIGRHNEAEMTAMSDRAFEALSLLLGENKYLMGDAPCGADATAFAFIAGSRVTGGR
jgi:glutathione S-transferase